MTAPTVTQRPLRTNEVFHVECWKCFGSIEIPVFAVNDSVAHCPRCGTKLILEWRPAT